MNKKLYLEFKDETGETMKLTINDPADDLNEEKVNLQMTALISAGVFDSKGANISEIKSAYIIEQTKTKFLGE